MSQSKTIKIQCKAADVLPLDAIVEFQGGLKKRGKKEIALMIKSIEKYGFSFPFMVWQNSGINHCLDGHGRIQALGEMRRTGTDIPLLPVVYVDAKDEEEAKNKLLRLNSQYGQMTIDSVMDFVSGIEVEFEELMLHGDVLKIKSQEEETVGDDEAPELQEEAVSMIGEIYELGPHRLICGDSTIPETLDYLLGDKLVDLYISDPPYNVAYEGKTKQALKIENDSMDDEKFRCFLGDAFTNASAHMKKGAPFYIWHADSEGLNFRLGLRDADLEHKQTLIWNKNSMVMGRQDYQWKHEPCLYGWKKGGSHTWYSDRKQTTVINMDRPTRNGEHPTMKPVDLFAYQISNSTKTEDIVLDNFLGSGTSIIASAKTGRICYGVELDPKYCDVIRRRWTKWARENGQEVGSGALEPIDG